MPGRCSLRAIERKDAHEDAPILRNAMGRQNRLMRKIPMRMILSMTDTYFLNPINSYQGEFKKLITNGK